MANGIQRDSVAVETLKYEVTQVSNSFSSFRFLTCGYLCGKKPLTSTLKYIKYTGYLDIAWWSFNGSLYAFNNHVQYGLQLEYQMMVQGMLKVYTNYTVLQKYNFEIYNWCVWPVSMFIWLLNLNITFLFLHLHFAVLKMAIFS